MRQGQQHRRGRGRHNNNNNNNNNNNRKGQNPLARSFESNGPDVKVRGTPAHIAEKYLQLARDAQSSGDPVLAENYLQHAEHYTRIIMAYREQQGFPPGDQNQAPRMRPQPGDFGDGDEIGDGEQPDDPVQSEQPTVTRFPHESRGGDMRGEGRGFGDSRHDARGEGRSDGGHRHDEQRQHRQDHPRFRDRHERRDRFEGRDRSERFDRDRDRDRDRPDRDRQDRDRPDRDRPDRERPDRERMDRDRQDRDRTMDRDRPERGERPERAERSERGERPERSDRGERGDRAERAAYTPAPERERFEAGSEPRPQEPAGEARVVRERAVEEAPVVVAASPEAEGAPAPRAEGAPRRRERYADRSADRHEPDFLRRPVRRQRREADPQAQSPEPAADDTPRE